MILENSLLLALGAFLTLLALVVAVMIGMEVVRLIREIFAGPGEPARRPTEQRAAESKTSLSETGPLASPERVQAFRDRETVERLIDHFEGERESHET